jgi:hypothetical protein
MAGADRGGAAVNDTPAWSHIAAEVDHACALDAAMLARALRGLGLVREATLRRGDIPGWAPAYQRLTPWRARYMACGSLHARGWRQREWQDMPAAEARMDAQDQRDRERIAEANRSLRDAVVFLLSRDALDARDARQADQDASLRAQDAALAAWFATPAPRGPRPVPVPAGAMPRDFLFLELDSFAWRDRTGAAFGQGLGSLGAFVWRVGQGKALARIARLVGVPMVTVRELERRMAREGAVINAAA